MAQVTQRGYSVKEVAERLGISSKSLYTWMAQFSKPQKHTDQEAEVRRLKKELARVTEERDIIKKATAYFARDANRGTRSLTRIASSILSVFCAKC